MVLDSEGADWACVALPSYSWGKRVCGGIDAVKEQPEKVKDKLVGS
jgi:hypothetical protein